MASFLLIRSRTIAPLQTEHLGNLGSASSGGAESSINRPLPQNVGLAQLQQVFFCLRTLEDDAQAAACRKTKRLVLGRGERLRIPRESGTSSVG